MDDSTPERSLGGTADAHEPDDEAIARLLARTQAERRRARTIITVDRDTDGYILTFRYLTADQAERIIRQARRPLPRAAQRALHFLDRLRPKRGGRKRGITDRPDFFDLVLRHMHHHQQEFDTPLDFATAVKQAGGSRSRAYASLAELGLEPEDLKHAASFGTYADGRRYLHSLQQDRR